MFQMINITISHVYFSLKSDFDRLMFPNSWKNSTLYLQKYSFTTTYNYNRILNILYASRYIKIVIISKRILILVLKLFKKRIAVGNVLCYIILTPQIMNNYVTNSKILTFLFWNMDCRQYLLIEYWSSITKIFIYLSPTLFYSSFSLTHDF